MNYPETLTTSWFDAVRIGQKPAEAETDYSDDGTKKPSPEQISEIRRQASMARWGRHKAEQKRMRAE